MSDKPLTVEIPEELLTQVESAQLDVRQIMIEAFNREIKRLHLISSQGSTLLARYPSDEAIEQVVQDSLKQVATQPDATDDGIRPTLEEIEAAIKASQQRLASPDAPRRTLGLHQGTIWVSDDFDDELPDEFWFGEDTEEA
jgi:uncharacterized membrane protein YccC